MIIKNRDKIRGPNTDWRYTFEKRFVKPYKKILVTGCYIYEPIEVGATHACDITDKYKQKLIDNGFKGEYKVGDVKNLPYGDKEFDCVLCCEVLEHVGNIDNAKKAISEILRVGKHFLISVPYKKDIYHSIPCVYFDEEILKNLFPPGTHIFSKRPYLFASNNKVWLEKT